MDYPALLELFWRRYYRFFHSNREDRHAPFFILAALAALSTEVSAQENPLCMPRAEWVKALQTGKYKEAAIGRGLTASSSIMIELYASADGSTWTITFSDTSGRTCGLAAGQDWQTIVPVVGDPS